MGAKAGMDVDVAIVGGGVAGIAAALWCARLALRCVLLERGDALGGQLFHIHNPIPDYPGVQCDGKAFADRLEAQLADVGIVPQRNTEVQEVSLDEGCLQTSMGEIRARAIVAATGASRRRLQVPGAAALEGKGLYFSFSGHREAFRDRRVCVVGGGDGAFENALMLAACCPQVTLLLRGQTPRARADFVAAVVQHHAIEVYHEAHVRKVLGDDQLTGVRIHHGGEEKTLAAEALLVKIGLAPAVGWLGGACDLHPAGTLLVDANHQTSHPRVWAIGDLCTPEEPSISVSVGQACLALRHIQRTLRDAP